MVHDFGASEVRDRRGGRGFGCFSTAYRCTLFLYETNLTLNPKP